MSVQSMQASRHVLGVARFLARSRILQAVSYVLVGALVFYAFVMVPIHLLWLHPDRVVLPEAMTVSPEVAYVLAPLLVFGPALSVLTVLTVWSRRVLDPLVDSIRAGRFADAAA